MQFPIYFAHAFDVSSLFCLTCQSSIMNLANLLRISLPLFTAFATTKITVTDCLSNPLQHGSRKNPMQDPDFDFFNATLPNSSLPDSDSHDQTDNFGGNRLYTTHLSRSEGRTVNLNDQSHLLYVDRNQGLYNDHFEKKRKKKRTRSQKSKLHQRVRMQNDLDSSDDELMMVDGGRLLTSFDIEDEDSFGSARPHVLASKGSDNGRGAARVRGGPRGVLLSP